MTTTNTEALEPTPDNDATTQAVPSAQAPAQASSVEYSAGVVRLGNIKPAAPEVEEATPDITDKGGDNLDKKSFADFGVTDPIVDALEDKGITHPFPIQALTLGPALDRHDIIGQAKTGTGKTLGFGIPVLEDVIAPDEEGYEDLLNPNQPQALIILPTRELTKQVAQDLREAAKYLSTRIVEIYGGVAFEPQIEALQRGADIVVARPVASSTYCARATCTCPASKPSSSTRPMKCSTWASCPTSKPCWAASPRTATPCCSPRLCPAPSWPSHAASWSIRPTSARRTPDDQNQTVNTVKQVIYRVTP